MADNVAITAGSGTTVATDDVAGVHYQQVKLVASALDSASPLSRAEDAAHTDGEHGIMALAVRNYAGAGTDGDYSALSAASDGNLRVDAHRDCVVLQAQSSGLTTATTAYSAGDQVGAIFSLASAARASGGNGVIVGVTLTSALDATGPFDVVFFRDTVTLAADNAAFSISAADTRKVVGIAALVGVYDLGSGRIATTNSIGIPYDCTASTLYAALITRVGHTFFGATTDLELTVYVERN